MTGTPRAGRTAHLPPPDPVTPQGRTDPVTP